MLQEATKALNSAFNNSFIKKLSQYLHDCVREEVKSTTFRNLKADKDNKWLFLKDEEELLTTENDFIKLDGADNKLTELMIQSEASQKDKSLIYGYLFLVGKSGKTKRQNEFLTPLLYIPCKLERNGININCIPTDEFVSLNTGAIAALIKKTDDEDEVEMFLEGLLNVVPQRPITQEKMEIFLTTLKSIVPDLDLNFDISENIEEDNVEKDFYEEKVNSENIDEIIEEEITKSTKIPEKPEKLILTKQSAIILTKRPTITAGVLHELMHIAEKPSGFYRETALNVINEEYLQAKGKAYESYNKETDEDFVALTPLSLSDSQESVIKEIETNKFVSVYGPPGTGKTQTIVNLAAHLITTGKTVLIVSRMDKAVDVVAERLNNLGAKFLALRAGRLNYQRQLSFQLQDLLSKKIDLDDDLAETMFADVEDMEKLIKSIKELEVKCEKIIDFESQWQETFAEKKSKEILLGSRKFIKSLLKKSQLELIKDAIKIFDENLDKSGFFSSVSIYNGNEKVKKALDLKKFKITEDNLQELKGEFAVAKLEAKMRFIESEIQKIGNLHALIREIHNLKSKQHDLAVNVLKRKRRESLKGLMQEQSKKQRLYLHSRSLLERKKKLQSSLLEGEDFRPLLEAFPCWCITTYAISGTLPMKPGLFDVVIIDEASQCDIASCFPALYRAKKAVVVGDDKQLPHLSFLEKAKEQSFLTQYGIPDKYQLMWRFRNNSMFDIANYYSLDPVLLDEHFRCLPAIINFSNEEFYGGRMRVMRQNASTEKVLEIVQVPDGKVDSSATKNLAEVEAVVKRIHEIILDDEQKNPDNPVSIGIISPFRAQVDQLKDSVRKVLSDRLLNRHQVEIGTAHAFQGDERDIILISWAYAENSYGQSLNFLQKPNLFNVAITRAKNKMINFVSKDIASLPDGIFRSYLNYVKEYESHQTALLLKQIDENCYKNDLEKEVANAVREMGFEVKAGLDIAGFSADLAVGNNLIIEIDGVPDNKKSKITPMKKQFILERCGFKVRRITFREWSYSKKACLERALI